MENKILASLEWTPVSGNSSSFCSHKLVRNTSHLLEFVPTKIAKAFYLLFFILPSIFLIMLTIAALQLAAPVFSLLFGILGVIPFFYFGFFLKESINSPRIFDLSKGEYYAIEKGLITAEKEIRENIRSIQALQILKKEVSDSENDYTSYELNLVFENGRRLNVMSHGGQKQLKEDAELLSKTLNIPVMQ